MVPVLDLFSGIGGFSLALRGICKTVAYCEISPEAQAVLSKNMKRGLLDHAPIFPDVTKLRGKDLPIKPRMITAGFPCQDISAANRNGLGIKGSRSGLYVHILRLVDECPGVQYVLLENSPAILFRGYATVERAFLKRRFRVAYGIFGANEAGAPTVRKRWVFLASRGPPILPRCVLKKWRPEPAVRVLPRVEQDLLANTTQCSLLGNAVVPQCMCMAFKELCAMLQRGIVFRVQKPYVTVKPTHAPLHLSDKNRSITIAYWGCPFAQPHLWKVQYNQLTERSTRVLSNQIFYEAKTLAQVRKAGHLTRQLSKHWMVNPGFVEWIMGYPTGYTKIYA